jgi:microcystin-dependent protein
MAYSRRSYKGAAVSNALGGSGLAANATSITLAAAMSGWSTSGTPFFVVVDPGTAKEEKLCVIYASSTTLTVVDPAVTSAWSASVNGRGVDDTTDRAHDVGATIYPVFTATEANQANELVSKYTTNGDIVVHGSSGPKTISTGGSGNNNKVLVADSTVSDGGVKWSSVGTDNIADDAITAAKILANAVGSSEIASGAVGIDELATAVVNRLVPVGTIAMYGGASAPTGWLLCNGDAIDAGYTGLRAIVGTTTPDLKGRFAIGDNSTLTLLGTGGSTTIGTNNLPSHQHSFSATTGGMSANATLSHTVTDPGHAHTINGVQTLSGLDYLMDALNGGAGGGAYTEPTASATTGVGVNPHDVSHTHSVSGNTGNTGGAEAYFQPYLVVNYIIKHD